MFIFSANTRKLFQAQYATEHFLKGLRRLTIWGGRHLAHLPLGLAVPLREDLVVVATRRRVCRGDEAAVAPGVDRRVVLLEEVGAAGAGHLVGEVPGAFDHHYGSKRMNDKIRPTDRFVFSSVMRGF